MNQARPNTTAEVGKGARPDERQHNRDRLPSSFLVIKTTATSTSSPPKLIGLPYHAVIIPPLFAGVFYTGSLSHVNLYQTFGASEANDGCLVQLPPATHVYSG